MLILPNKTTKVWERFIKENKALVHKYIVKQIKRGIENNKDSIDLFRSEDGTIHSSIKREHYLDQLEEALKLFIKEEEYESAAKTKRIMIEYQINNVIRESVNTIEE